MVDKKKQIPFKLAFNEARNAGKGVFWWNGKLYNTRLSTETEEEFRGASKKDITELELSRAEEYDKFIGGHLDFRTEEYYDKATNTLGGWKFRDEQSLRDALYKANDLEELVGNTAEDAHITVPIINPELKMFSDLDIKDLEFRNYAELVSAANNLNNADNNFIKALKARFGETNSWNQEQIERDLGVSGKYRRFGAGDFGDMSRSMAAYIGDYDAKNGYMKPLFNRRETRNYLSNKGLDPYAYTGAERKALRLYLNGETYDSDILKNSSLNDQLNLKLQQGGKINMNEQELQQAFIQFLAQKTGAQSQQELEAVIQQLGEEGLKQAYAEFMLVMQLQQVQAAKFGAKLNYIKKLRGQCPEGYEAQYFKSGGRLCKKCIAKQKAVKEDPKNPIDAFKCGSKMKKSKKMEDGGSVKTKKQLFPLKETKNGKTRTVLYDDRATRDSIAVNRYNDEITEGTMPGSYKKNEKGKIQWTPDRSKSPYKKN